MISVLIIEDDEDIRQGLQLLIHGTDGYVCVGDYASCEQAIANIEKANPDVVLLDIELPGMSGIDGLSPIKGAAPAADIIMLTNFHDDSKVFESLCRGASGYLLKSIQPAKLLEAIKDVRSGGAPMTANIARMVVQSFRRTASSDLTRRETEILGQLVQGKSYKMIADALFISQGTVHSHIKNIYSKLEVNSKSEAVAKALQERLV